MPFECAAFQKFRQEILFEDRDGTGIEADSFPEDADEILRDHHVAHAERRRNRAGEAVQVNDVFPAGKAVNGVFRLS